MSTHGAGGVLQLFLSVVESLSSVSTSATFGTFEYDWEFALKRNVHAFRTQRCVTGHGLCLVIYL